MSLQPVVILLDTLIPSGLLGDSDDGTPDVENTAPASQGYVESPPTALGLSFASSLPINAIAIRLKGEAHVELPPTVAWQSGSGRIKWSVGADQDELQPLTPLPKDTHVPDWIQTPSIPLQPNGQAWTRAAINALSVWDRVAWTSAPSGNVTMSIVEARVIVYAEVEADVHAVAVGAGTPVAAWVGAGDLPGASVGAGALATAWVGEED